MLIRWLFAAVHLLALGIGLGAVWGRARALGGLRPAEGAAVDAVGLRRVFYADNWWAVAAVVWIGTGLVRAFGGLEKGSVYYLHNTWFLAKMACLAAILVLEVRPMVTLIRWRALVAKGAQPMTSSAKTLADISTIQAVLIVVMVLLATAMARGVGFRAL